MSKRNEYLLVFLCEGRIESINLFGESFEKVESFFYDIHDSTGLNIDLLSITKIKEDE